MICDIDNTITHFSFFSFLFKDPLREVDGAKEVLAEISEKYYIVYLTHRDKRFTAVTKSWLSDHDFPLGPVFFWSIGEDPFTSKKYKINTLEKIREKSQLDFMIGIGDKQSDIEAYKKAKIPKYFLIKDSDDWKKIGEEI